jgi:hypothetical protein
VHAGGVGNHTVEVKQDGIVLVAADRRLAFRLPHRIFLPVVFDS